MTRRLWPWLRLAIALGILAVLGWRLGTGAFLDGLRVIGPGSLLAALGIGLLTTVCSAARWCLIARRLGLELTLPAAVRHYYRALLLNAVLPAGILGDVHRAVDHGRRSGDVGRGMRAVFLERFAGQLILLSLGAVVLVTQPSITRDLLPGKEILLGVLAVVIVVAAVVLWARRGGGRIRRGVTRSLADARCLLARDTGPRVALLSLITLAGHVGLFVVAARAAGADVPVTRLIPLLVLALVVMGLPLNIGGWGPREAFLALAFGAAGLGADQGLTAGVVYGVLTLVSALPGVLVLGYESRIARYSPKPATSAASTSLPFRADASEGRPTIPEAVYAASPSVSR